MPARAEHPEWSVARRWDEALLDAIRRALPNPPVHARNLFHTSVAMWDAWAAYDPTADGYIVTEKENAGDVAAARNEAISYAAYRVLVVAVHQGGRRRGVARRSSPTSWTRCATRWTSRRPTATRPRPWATGSAPPCIAYGQDDGSNQADGYAATDYKPVNDPLVVAKPGTTMKDPNRWQPLQIEHMISQNGIPVDERRPAGRRPALGPRDGVRPARTAAQPDARSTRARRRSWAGSRHGCGVQGPGRRGHPR